MATPPTFSLFLLISFSLLLSISAELCNPSDKSTLLKIKQSLQNSPRSFSTWKPNTDCCKTWDNIVCSENGAPTGRVTLLTIAGDEAIVGPLPPSIGDLPYLATLQIFSNPNLTGPIPVTIGKLTRLTFLALSANKLTGPIPGSLGHLTRLENLDLESNRLTGTIPPSLSLLPVINNLDLSFNQLTGSIPASFGAFKTGLLLQVVNNRLSGPIPRSLGRANLTTLDVSGNKFTGDVSFVLNGRDKALESIVLRGNRFKFDISKVDLPRGLKLIDIAENMIYGSLPRRLGQLPLNFIDVSYNQLCGPIPKGRRLKQFRPLRFGHNKCLCDLPLPPCKK